MGFTLGKSFLVYLLARSDFSFFTGAEGGQVDPRALIKKNVSVVNQTIVQSGFDHLPPLQGVLPTKGLSASVPTSEDARNNLKCTRIAVYQARSPGTLGEPLRNPTGVYRGFVRYTCARLMPAITSKHLLSRLTHVVMGGL